MGEVMPFDNVEVKTKNGLKIGGMKRALDIGCCQGGASEGLARAGYKVTGIDINPQPKYRHTFILADGLTFALDGFDFLWASLPCQGYSFLTPPAHRAKYPKLIGHIRERFIKSGIPYCIENVAGARKELNDPCMLCGSMFGLRTRRHRYFETSFPLSAPKSCDHSEIPLLVTTASKASRELRFKLGMNPKSVKNAPAAYGIDWMDTNGLKEAIPPAYSEYIGRAAA